jgi:hypothetical protein
VWSQEAVTFVIRDEETRDVEYVKRAGPPKGAADITGIIKPEGWRLEIECKIGSRKRSPQQDRWGEFVQSFGGIYILLSSDNTVNECVDEVIRRIAMARKKRLWLGWSRA